MRSRSRILALLLGLASFLANPGGTAAADGEYDSRPDETNSIHAGATSVQFLTFGGGTNGIYVKHHFSDRTAVRVGTDFYISESSGESPPGEPLQAIETRDHSYTITSEVQYFVDARGPVTTYLGIGPSYSRYYYSNEREGIVTYPPFVPGYSYSRNVFEGWRVGATASVGFEWFFRRRLSVIGRAGASVAFGRSHQEYADRFVDEQGQVDYDRHDAIDLSTAIASTSYAALGLGLHF